MNGSHRFALLALAALAAGGGPAHGQTPREAARLISMEQARERAARVSDVRYALVFSLDGESPEFTGKVTMRFQLAGAEGALTVDFSGGTVTRTVVNDHEIDADYNGFFITLPARALRPGANTVAIDFAHPYSNDGSGLYRFRDPEDGRDYLYTDFEPYDQNRLFPSFDQPDLKARYSTEVTAPQDWQVISIVAESNVAGREGKRTWTFPESQPISTYIYALHAGHYRQWESSAGDVPLRLFARESMTPYVHPEHWFVPTRQGFRFFERYFEVPYPFGKYDQVIVPHFNAGAMENVGAVTFSERYLRRGTVTRQNRRAIASVILHEMAHMWFGDLVTMDWWNGLWLNESFATFMATLAMVEATEFTDEWQSAYRRTIRAYEADERETTHPIELPIPDTDAAFANFDAITYNKGSATLTQLNHLVGPETFRRGVSRYLSEHVYGNTTIDDFLDAISDASGEDLDGWANDWLHEPGANRIAVELACEDAVVSAMTIVQSAPDEWPTLRTHRTQLGLYRFAGGGVEVRTLPVTYSGERTAVTDGDGEACPDMIYGNHEDWDYVRVALDDESVRALREHLNDFEDPLVRSMLWQGVYDLVLATRMTPAEFIEFALASLRAETVDEVTRQVLGSLQGALSYLIRVQGGADDLAELGPKVERYLWEAFMDASPGSGRQLMMFDSFVESVTSEAGIASLAGMLEGEAGLPDGFVFDQDRRWTVLQTLSGFGHGEVDRYLAAERGRDASDRGRLRAMGVEAARPQMDVKRRWAEELLAGDSELTVADARAVAGGLFPAHQYPLQLELTDTVFERLHEVNSNKDPGYFDSITRGLLGTLCDAGYADALDRAIADSAGLHPGLRKRLLDTRFDVRRCLAVAEQM